LRLNKFHKKQGNRKQEEMNGKGLVFHLDQNIYKTKIEIPDCLIDSNKDKKTFVKCGLITNWR
jgi:hypothetical protein